MYFLVCLLDVLPAAEEAPHVCGVGSAGPDTCTVSDMIKLTSTVSYVHVHEHVRGLFMCVGGMHA